VLLLGLLNVSGAAAQNLQLPDGRVYEMVSPVQKSGNFAGASTAAEEGSFSFIAEYAIAAPDGSAILYGANNAAQIGALGNVNSGADFFSVSSRLDTGWTTRAAVPPANGQKGIFELAPQSLLLSSDLSQAVFVAGASFGEAPSEIGGSVYLGHEDHSITWIGKPTIPDPNPPLNSSFAPTSEIVPAGGSQDLSSIYFTDRGTLTPEDDVVNPTFGTSRTKVIEGGAGNDSGFYEWTRSGGLTYAGVLPNGTVDPYGAVGAAVYPNGGFPLPEGFAGHQVSLDGSRAFFVSPDPTSGILPLSDPPEIYVRETALDGTQRTVLVSGSALTGKPATHRPETYPGTSVYMHGSPDGLHVVFGDVDQLTGDAPDDGLVKMYDFDTITNTLAYLPGVASATGFGGGKVSRIPASSLDGSRFIFDKQTPAGQELDLWSNGTITTVAQLGAGSSISVGRATGSGSVFVFTTNAPIPGFNNSGGFDQIYRYSVAPDGASGSLACVSCPPGGVQPSGSATLSANTANNIAAVADNRGMSTDGSRVFFDTPDPLVAGDINGRRDVYEWEGGSARLISSGVSPHDSFYLDNDLTGDNVFFATTDGLDPQDTDAGYDVYDARVAGGFPTSSVPTQCSGDACQGASFNPSVFGQPSSVTASGAGNLLPPPVKRTVRPRKSPQAGKLARALRECERKPRKRRASCRSHARKRYDRSSAVAKGNGRGQ
jgi:hypothetical protein